MISIVLVFSLYLISTTASNVPCDGFKTDFDIKKAIGTWHVVAVIPDTNYSRNFDSEAKCYQVDFSEADQAGLRWMVEQRFGKTGVNLIDNTPGEIIRLGYQSEQPFDVWSKAVPGVKGCYRQLVAFNSHEKDIHESKTIHSQTLLHLLETENGVYLLQMLWGRIFAIIHRREPGINMEQLRPVYEFLSLYRRHIEKPKLCNISLYTTTKRPEISTFLNKILQ